MLRNAVSAGRLSEDETEEIWLADLVYAARACQDGRPVVVVVQVSGGVTVRDVERILARARYAAALSESGMGVVAALRIDPDAQVLAEQTGVRLIINPEEWRSRTPYFP